MRYSPRRALQAGQKSGLQIGAKRVSDTDKNSRSVLTTTLIGGALFLVPLVVLAAILGEAYKLMKLVAGPIAEVIPVGSFAGVAVLNLFAVFLILVVCLAAGTVARSKIGHRIVVSLERRLLDHIPVYTFIKGMTAGLSGTEESRSLPVVLIRMDDHSEVAFETERLSDGRVVAFVPGAPNPWSGSLTVVDSDRVELLDTTMPRVVRSIQRLGAGSSALLDKPVSGA